MKPYNVTLGLLLVGLLAAPVTGCGKDDNNGEDNNTATTPVNNNSESKNAIRADDQDLGELAGRVSVASVVADVDSFVVIHADDNGAPGEVLGHVSVTEGETTDVEVTLSRDAVDGEVLHAMLHVDDPADGEYTFGQDEGGDDPALDSNGDVVVDDFKVSVDVDVETMPAVTVVDQDLAVANEVVIASVTAAVDGYIVIHALDENGDVIVSPDLGSAAVSAGETTALKVTLTRDALDGETLVAMLHSEDNDTQTYDGASIDAPVKDADGNVVAPSFEVTVSASGPVASVTVVDQTLDRSAPDKVTIGEVVAAAPGYIVIHEADASGDIVVDPAIGFAAVEAGINTDVEVTLTRDAVDGETLFAMLHTEDNANTTYDGPGVDLPVLDADEMIITPAFVVSFDLLAGVTVSDQTADPATEVLIDQVNAVEAGFIVIHEANESGELVVEPALGAAAVSVGGNTDVSVTLTRPVLDGETLFAMLHTDDNNNGTYDGPAVDLPVKDSNDAVITPSFTANAGTSEPSVTVYDQLSDPANEVTIRQVLYDSAGWLVIHEDGGGMFGDVIGKVAVTAGVNTDLTVTLDRNISSGETLYAMLHSDDGDGIYEFPGADGPVVDAQGNVVVPTFVATTPENSVDVMAQTLSQVSTVVTLGEVYALKDGYVVIHEDNAGAPGDVVGVVPVSRGLTASSTITLSRPGVSGETLHAMLHTEDNANSSYDGESVDLPALDLSGAVVVEDFVLTVAAGTPAVIIVLDANGNADYVFESVFPTAFESLVMGGTGAADSDITLQQGWRYRFDLSTNGLAAHPIQFGELGTLLPPVADDWKLVQGSGGDATFESDAGINWDDSNGDVTFTVTSILAAELETYQCVNHDSMSANIIIEIP